MSSNNLMISGYSTARYATWYFLEQYNILFDAGDGAVANLRGKCGKVRHLFLSHADRDHLGSLIQFYQTVAQSPAPPTFYYPKDSGSFPALRDFLEKFDPHLPRCQWVPVEAGMRIEIHKNLFVEVGENRHIIVANRDGRDKVKSLDFTLVDTRRKLKEKFQGLSGQEIRKLRMEKGEEFITDTVDRRLFGYSGDTPDFDIERWQGTEILAHEATFISPDEADRGHCELNSVIDRAAQLDLKALIIGHISVRYKPEYILNIIRQAAERSGITFPIYAVLPGAIKWDILSGKPVWEGAVPD